MPDLANLIYKTTKEVIKEKEGASIFLLPSQLLGEETPRTVFVSKEVRDTVTGPFRQDWEGRYHSSLRAMMDSFSEGAEFSVATNPFDKPVDALLARTDPIEAEVWDLRCFAPHPGIRAMGRFSEPDVFVALTWNYREIVDWPVEIARCQRAWDAIFQGVQPFKGTSVDEYVTFNAYAV